MGTYKVVAAVYWQFFTPGHFGLTEVAAVFTAMEKKSKLDALDIRIQEWFRKHDVNYTLFFITVVVMMSALSFMSGMLWVASRI